MTHAQRRIVAIVLLVSIAAVLIAVVLVVTAHRPAVRAAPSASATPVRIPIDVEHDFEDTVVTVPVTIGAHVYHFTLDTGASTTAVNGTVLHAVHATDTGDDAQFEDASGDVEDSRLFRIESWSIGGVALQRNATVANLARPLDTDGLLGSDQLSRFGRVTIDYDAEELILIPRSSR